MIRDLLLRLMSRKHVAKTGEVANASSAPVSEEIVRHAITLIGADGASEDDIERTVVECVHDKMLARRLIDCIPEAFGIILISHMGKVTLPKTFSAKASDGSWQVFGFEAEPIFKEAVKLAAEIYHSGPRNLFSNVATRSAVVGAVNRALNAGESLDGAALSGPALNGIPAEFYA